MSSQTPPPEPLLQRQQSVEAFEASEILDLSRPVLAAIESTLNIGGEYDHDTHRKVPNLAAKEESIELTINQLDELLYNLQCSTADDQTEVDQLVALLQEQNEQVERFTQFVDSVTKKVGDETVNGDVVTAMEAME